MNAEKLSTSRVYSVYQERKRQTERGNDRRKEEGRERKKEGRKRKVPREKWPKLELFLTSIIHLCY